MSDELNDFFPGSFSYADDEPAPASNGDDSTSSVTRSSSSGLDTSTVACFIQNLILTPDVLMGVEHRFLRQQILAAADIVNNRTAAMRLEGQRRRFKEGQERERVSDRTLPPPSDAMCNASRPLLLTAPAGEHTGDGTPAPAGSISTALMVGSSLLDRKATLAALRRDRDRDRAPKPHLATLHQADPSSLNRHQLQDATRTVRQLRHIAATRCYVCKLPMPPEESEKRHPFFTNHCLICGDENAQKRHILHDLTGRIAVVTGARIKIGFLVGLKLLRCGATLIATSRFPANTLMRYEQEPDFDVWKSRLHILYADLCNPKEVQDLSHRIMKLVPHVDILINNAAQTIRRPLPYYDGLNRIERTSQQRMLTLLSPEAKERLHKQLMEDSNTTTTQQRKLKSDSTQIHTPTTPTSDTHINESVEVCDEIEIPAKASPSSTSSSTPATLDVASVSGDLIRAGGCSVVSTASSSLLTASDLCGTALVELPRLSFTPYSLIPEQDHLSSDESERLFPKGKVDVINDCEPLDLRNGNSWNAKSEDIDPRELAEVLSTNSMAPFILSNMLRPWMLKSPYKHRYLILVSSMEGKLNRSKANMHAHTNMAKASLNAFTRTVASEWAMDSIYVNSVDTGWNSEERAVNDPQRDPTFETPLDCADGAARILDPIFMGEIKQQYIFGQFLKDYAPSEW